MVARLLCPMLLTGLALLPLAAQECASVPTFASCDLVFEMTEPEAAQHPNPYLSVQLHAEFRSPRHRTIMMPGFWDGGRRLVIRFTPIDPGEWAYRVTSNVVSVNGKQGQVNAPDSGHPGFLRVDNKRAWSTTETRSPHLWMGDTSYRFAWMEEPVFEQMIAARAGQRFNHIRGLVMHDEEQYRKAYLTPDRPNVEHFQQLDRRIRAMNQKGIFADLILAGDRNHLTRVFPERDQRERYVKYLVSRYAPMMITWQGVQEFEEYDNGRALLKEINLAIMKFDPYKHPRSTHTTATSAPLLEDGWMTHAMYQSSADALGAVERQILSVPMVNAEFGYEDSGAGKSHPHHVDADTFRKRLWNATMNGQLPTYGNTGTYGGRKFQVDPKYLEAPGVKAMSAWYELFSKTRHWELEPYFEITAGRALALGGIEYIVYLEQPGPVEVVTEKKKYEVYWFRPSTGEIVQEKKEYKGEKFIGQPPDNNSDWVLHLSRDGRKEGMAKSWKFESRPIFQQEVERSPAKTPFEMEAPKAEELPVGKPIQFVVKLTKETRASKMMMYLWTVEATNDPQGYRVLGTTQKGEFTIPRGLARIYPAVINLRVYGINGNGKVYALDRVLRATE
jgi:hypothetical protein